jgi:hypothetical protein
MMRRKVDLRCLDHNRRTVGFSSHGLVGEQHDPKARFVACVIKCVDHHHLEVRKQLGE